MDISQLLEVRKGIAEKVAQHIHFDTFCMFLLPVRLLYVRPRQGDGQRERESHESWQKKIHKSNSSL